MTIIDQLLNCRQDKPFITIRSQKPVVTLLKNRLYIGRTPGRFVNAIGHRTGEELSIQDALKLLGATEAARNIFPLAATPGTHWIYFALFSACRQLPGIMTIQRYLDFLDNKLRRPRAGVARRLLDSNVSKKIFRRSVERARRVHDIRLRIPNVSDRTSFIDITMLYALDNLIQSGYNSEKRFQIFAHKFRHAWCRQSLVLRERNYSSLIKKDRPNGIENESLLRVYAGYWLIRGLYGIEVQSLENGEDEGRSEVKRLNEQCIRKSARNAIHYLKNLFKHDKPLESHARGILELLNEAAQTGEAPLIREYYRRQAEGRRILNGFRLNRFWQVLSQLDEAVGKGFNYERY